jgi:thiamine-monophosphate kinase
LVQQYVLAGGDDYELCFTASGSRADEVREAASAAGVDVTRIGQIMAGAGVTVVDASGCPLRLERGGYDHFG